MDDGAARASTGEPFELPHGRGKVREFARPTFSANQSYLDDPAPVIPPTFLATMAFWSGPGTDPWNHVRMDQSRGLHAEQELVFHGPPPRAGTTLTATSRIADITTKPGRRGGELTFVTMVTEFRDADGNLVAEAKLTGVETSHLDPSKASS